MKLKRFLAMMMTVIMTAGTLGDAGFTVFAADAADETVSDDAAETTEEDAASEDEAEEPGSEAELPEEGGDITAPEDEDDLDGFNIWVGGVQVTADNYKDIGGVTGEGAKASYDLATSTLKLENVEGFEHYYQIPGKGGKKALIYADQSITISGDIYFEIESQFSPYYGIYVAGSDHTLTLDTDNCRIYSTATGIETEGDLKTGKNFKECWIEGNRYSEAVMVGGSAYFTSGDFGCEAGYYGLWTAGDIHMDGGSVRAVAKGQDEKGYAIWCDKDFYFNSGCIEGKYSGNTYKDKGFGGLYITGDLKVDWDKAYINTPDGGYFKDHNFYWGDGKLAYWVIIDIDDSPKYDVWVGGIRLSQYKADPVFGLTEGVARYNNDNKTLTLEDVKSIKGSKNGSWIYAEQDITVAGNAALTEADASLDSIISTKDNYSITVNADIDTSKLYKKPASVIRSGKDLTLKDTKISGTGTTYGLYASKKCTIEGSVVKTSGDSCGLYAGSDITIQTSDVEVISAGANDSAGVALKASGKINVESGNLIARANANNGGVAIKGNNVDDGLKINKEKLEIIEPEGATVSNGTVVDKDGKAVSYVKTGVVTPYDVWVGATRVTDKNYDDVLGNGKVKYYPTSQTLEFNDLKPEDLTDYYISSDKTFCIYIDQDLQMIGTAEFYGADNVILQNKGTLGLAGQFDMRANNSCYQGSAESWINFYGGETVMSSDYAPVFTFGGVTMYGGEWRLACAGTGTLCNGVFAIKEFEIKNGRFKSYGDSGAIAAGGKIKLSDEVEIYEPEGGKLSADELRIVDKDNEIAKTVIIDKKLPTYTVAFNMNEHGTAPATQNVREGYKAVEPKAPTAEGWIFAGWYEEKACINRYDFETPVTGPITLYACWLDASKTYYKVTFDLNGHGTTAPAVQNVEAGAKATEPTAPAADDGYDFKGWYTDKEGNEAYDFGAAVNADITLYAKWVAKTKHFTVSFDLNGKGSGSIASQTVDEGQTATAPEAPEDPDYTFTGWYTEKECVNIYDFSTPVTANITLYAGWGDKVSALNPVPVFTASTKELYLVKGQKFTIGDGWEVDKSFKKYVKISKKGVLSAKKVTEAPVEIKNGERIVKVTVVKPAYTGKIKFTDVGTYKALSEVFNVGTNKIPVALYSNNPAVVYIAGDKIVPVGSGSATLTAYVNGKAYTTKVSVKETTPDQVHHMYMTVNDKKTLSVKGVKIVEWHSGDDTIVKIDKKKAVALKSGYVQIDGKDKEGKEYYIYTYVEDPTITSADIKPSGKNKYTVDLKKGQSAQIVYTKISQWPVIFKSSKGEIAYADENGKIHAQNVGKSKLTVKINGKTITIRVNVTE